MLPSEFVALWDGVGAGVWLLIITPFGSLIKYAQQQDPRCFLKDHILAWADLLCVCMRQCMCAHLISAVLLLLPRMGARFKKMTWSLSLNDEMIKLLIQTNGVDLSQVVVQHPCFQFYGCDFQNNVLK